MISRYDYFAWFFGDQSRQQRESRNEEIKRLLRQISHKSLTCVIINPSEGVIRERGRLYSLKRFPD